MTTVENVKVVLKTSARWTMDLRPGTEDMWLKEFSRSNKYIAIIMRVLLIFFCQGTLLRFNPSDSDLC